MNTGRFSQEGNNATRSRMLCHGKCVSSRVLRKSQGERTTNVLLNFFTF